MHKEIHTKYERVEIYFEGNEFEFINRALSELAEAFGVFLFQDLGREPKTTILNINLCSEQKIIELNQVHRNKNKETDVLSFPLQENLRAGVVDDFVPEIELGDIFICEAVCKKQSEEFCLSFREEFLHLAIHGFLHLCGYDHEISEEEEKLMEKLEETLISKIKERQ